MTRTSALRAALLTVGLSLIATATAHAEYRGTDLSGQLFDSGHPVGGLADKYPMSRYSLDWHVDGGGLVPDPSSWPASVAHFLANQLWSGAMYLSEFVGSMLRWAVGLDLLTGEHGALRQVAHATDTLYNRVLGYEWFIVAILAMGAWLLKTAVAQRRVGVAMAALTASIIYSVAAGYIVAKPQETLGAAYRGVQTLSGALLAGPTTGTANPEQAQRRASDHLFETVVYKPWLALNFGGPRHCVDLDNRDNDGFPRPVLPDDPARDVCRDNDRYAQAYLKTEAGSDERKDVYESIKDGTGPWDRADSPAVDVQQEAAAADRLTTAAFVFVGALGMSLMLGYAAIVIIFAAVAIIGLFAFGPIAGLLALIPGWGHQVFLWWGGRILSALFVKVIYSLIVSVLLLVSIALTSGAPVMGYGLAFGMQAALFWGLFLYRKKIAGLFEMGINGSEAHKYRRMAQKTVTHPVRTIIAGGSTGGIAAAGVVASEAAGAAAATGAAGGRGAPPSDPGEPPPPPPSTEPNAATPATGTTARMSVPPVHGGDPPTSTGPPVPQPVPLQGPQPGLRPARVETPSEPHREPTPPSRAGAAPPPPPASPTPPPPAPGDHFGPFLSAEAQQPPRPATPPPNPDRKTPHEPAVPPPPPPSQDA